MASMRLTIIVLAGLGSIGCGGKIVDDAGEPPAERLRGQLGRGGVVELTAEPMLSAAFWGDRGDLEASDVSEWRDGPCDGWTRGTDRIAPSSSQPLDAGPVHAKTTRGALETRFHSDTYDRGYSSVFGKNGAWEPDAVVEVHVDGTNLIPGFTRTLTLPPTITIIAPQWQTTEENGVRDRGLTIDADEDLRLSWRGGHAGHEVVVRLRTMTLDDALVVRYFAECRFPGDGGEGLVPRSVFKAMRDSERAIRATHGSNYGLDFDVQSEVLRAADRNGFLVKVRASAPGLAADGGPTYGGRITLE
jgi:hypothetical protein